MQKPATSSLIPTLVSWSSGKDSAWMLHCLRRSGEYQIAGLLTTLNSAFDRVAMHGVSRALLDAQAEAAGLPLWPVPLPWPCSNQHYEAAMAAACARAVAEGIEAVAFGDLFLEDIRAYREARLLGTGLRPVFPLWKQPTGPLLREMLDAGVKACIVSLDPAQMPSHFIGRDLDLDLLAELPPHVDPCGENGEFHTFVYDGPFFRHPIAIERRGSVLRDGFLFADLIPAL